VQLTGGLIAGTGVSLQSIGFQSCGQTLWRWSATPAKALTTATRMTMAMRCQVIQSALYLQASTADVSAGGCYSSRACAATDAWLCNFGLQATTASQLEQPAVPVYLALVDVCCGEDTLELMRSALQAALEALPPAARFGLITYSQRVTWSSRGFMPMPMPMPCVQALLIVDVQQVKRGPCSCDCQKCAGF
jgi:Sec23/Sec24 trunk domain